MNASKVSPSADSRSTDVCRFRFDAATSTLGSNDPIGMSRKVSAWLRSAGTHLVSHFDFCGLADICRYGFNVAALTVESNDSISTVWRDSGWLHDVGTSQVSHFAFLCYFDTDALDLDLYRFDFGSIASTLGSNDPIRTFRIVYGWLHDVCGL